MKNKMQKAFLILTAISSIASITYASEKPSEDKSKLTHNPIYLRVDLLGEKFHKTSMQGVTYKQKNYSSGADVGLGYYVMPRLRLEAVYNHNFLARFKSNNNIKDKADIKALFLRTMFDVMSFDQVKLFVGAGIGGARISHELNGNVSGKSGFKYRPACSFHAGVALDLVEGVMVEASWSVRNYGKTSDITDTDGTKLKLRSQNISLGFRFDV